MYDIDIQRIERIDNKNGEYFWNFNEIRNISTLIESKKIALELCGNKNVVAVDVMDNNTDIDEDCYFRIKTYV